MVKVLIKKQLMELGAFVYQSGKKGKRRSKGSLILYILLMVYVVAAMGWLFYMMADMLCEPLAGAGLGWLFFAIVGLLAVVAGVFGSIFTAYSGLYRARDNELLLSMPVKPSSLLLARMTNIFIMSFDFTLVIMVPSILVYHMRGFGSVKTLSFQIIVTLLISLFAMVLSCVLGWIIGLISAHLKGSIKRLISIAVTIGFLGVYFYAYTKVYGYLQLILTNGDKIGNTVRRTLFPIYHLGIACEGNAASLLIFAVIVLVIFGLVYLALSRSFVRVATTKNGSVKTKYREKPLKAGTMGGALIRKEARHFVGSSVYFINCGLGAVFFLAGAVLVLVKADYIQGLIAQVAQMIPDFQGVLALLLAGSLALICSMNDITAPSISLEGKNIWILQSMPVSPWLVLKAKLIFHIMMTVVPGLICAACTAWVLGLGFAASVLEILFVSAFTVLGAAMGLAANLKMPNLDWVNETAVIKQSIPVLIAIFGSWLVVVVLGGFYFLFGRNLPPLAFLALAAVIVAAAAGFLIIWLRKKGTRIFTELS